MKCRLNLLHFRMEEEGIVYEEKLSWPCTSAVCNVTDDPKIKAEINKTFGVTFFVSSINARQYREALHTNEYSCVIIEGI